MGGGEWRGEMYSDPGFEASPSMRLVLPRSPLLKKRKSLSVIHVGSLYAALSYSRLESPEAMSSKRIWEVFLWVSKE